MILNVCPWVGEKLGWKESNVRIGFVVAFLAAGSGLVLYLVLWLVKKFSN
jgi:phage shock protein PspC (stress-responsive transcriptional regulator)